VAMADEYRSPLFDPSGRKWWGDGTPLSKTSLMVAEYADGGHGTMGVEKADFDRMIEEAKKGAVVRVHAMGDGLFAPFLTYSSKCASSALKVFRNLSI